MFGSQRHKAAPQAKAPGFDRAAAGAQGNAVSLLSRTPPTAEPQAEFLAV